MKEEQKHLSIMGIGPVYGVSIILLTILGCFVRNTEILQAATLSQLQTPSLVAGIVVLIAGILIFIRAQIDLSNHIEQNQLVTTGIYAYCRNPLYTSVMFLCISADLIANNLWLLILPFVYWLLMTILVKSTEEKWLNDLYGEKYRSYCKKVNRCFPWFPRRDK